MFELPTLLLIGRVICTIRGKLRHIDDLPHFGGILAKVLAPADGCAPPPCYMAETSVGEMGGLTK